MAQWRGRFAGAAGILTIWGTLMMYAVDRRSLSATKTVELSSVGASHSGSASVLLPDDDALMRLRATLTLSFGEAWVGQTLEVAVEYKPVAAGSSLPALWTRSTTVEVSSLATTAEVALFRLRPNHEYVYSVFAKVDGVLVTTAIVSGSFLSKATGWERFDTGAYVKMTGDTPSYTVATFAVYPSYLAHEETKQYFQGLLGVDAEGYVVWMYSLCMLEAWDFLPDDTIAVIAREDGACRATAGEAAYSGLGEDGLVYVANSQMQKIEPDGTLATQYIQSCAGGPMNFNKLSHECRVDHDSKDLRVLTTMYATTVVPNQQIPIVMGPTEVLYDHEDTFATTIIAAWNDVSGEIETLYDLSEFASPTDNATLFATTAWNTVHMQCGGDEARNAVEYHHVSAISVGKDQNYIVASRNLDTIWSLARDGSGRQWTLSSHDEIDSDFTWSKDIDKFYQPHGAIQLENGNILLIDDGTDRPGCTTIKTGECWSRAVMYKLDHDLGTVEVAWQFSFPDFLTADESNYETFTKLSTWNEVGGSAYKMHNGNYLIAFSSVDPSDENPKGTAMAFEIDVNGNHTASTLMEIPTPIANVGTQNGYRFIPWAAISGESATNPLLD